MRPTFAEAGITGVTLSNLANVKGALDADGTSPWTVSEIQAIVNADFALSVINQSIKYGSGPTPDETTFVTAGITGVTAENLNDVLDELNFAHQEFMRNPMFSTPWSTKDDIQAIVDLVTAN